MVVEGARLYREASGREEGGEYVPPTGYHNAYQLEEVVTYDGKLWRATRDGAIGVPGDSVDWVQVADEGEILPWVRPMAGTEYKYGDIVTHKGSTWRNDYQGLNGWEPGTTGAMWTNIDGE